MQNVQPLRQKAEVEKMKESLKKQSPRDWAMFVLGINTGLRISDLLTLTVADVTDVTSTRFKISERLIIKERKTGKYRDVLLNSVTRTALKEYITANNLICSYSTPLFPSQKGHKTHAITRVTAWRNLNKAARSAGIMCQIGTHTMRKTFGYHLYVSQVNITRIQHMLNHSSPAITLAYIGITQDETDNIIKKLCL